MNSILIQPSSALRIGLTELWQYRELVLSLVIREIRVRYKQTLIGILWALLQPAAMMLVFTLFFGRLAKIPSGELPYPVFALSGILLWNYFASALSGAANSLIEYKSLLSKVYFPRLVLPVASVAVGVIDFAITLTLLLIVAGLYGIIPGLAFLLAPVFLLLTAFTALSIGLWLAALNAMYRDVRYALPFFIQLWMFASPVVYPATLLPDAWQWLYALNPMVGLIEGFRWAILGVGQLPITMFISIAAMAIIFTGGVIFFRRTERTLADWI